MARISQEQTQERHTFLLDLFRSQPELSRQEAMDAFKEKFGSSINLKTLTELREQAQAEQGASGDSEAHESTQDEEGESSSSDEAVARLRAAASGGSSTGNGVSAQPAPKSAKPAKGAKQRNLFVDAPKEQLDFLQGIVAQLQEAGASNIRIDHATDRWMVVVVDAK
jgi:hypothetical protein